MCAARKGPKATSNEIPCRPYETPPCHLGQRLQLPFAIPCGCISLRKALPNPTMPDFLLYYSEPAFVVDLSALAFSLPARPSRAKRTVRDGYNTIYAAHAAQLCCQKIKSLIPVVLNQKYAGCSFVKVSGRRLSAWQTLPPPPPPTDLPTREDRRPSPSRRLGKYIAPRLYAFQETDIQEMIKTMHAFKTRMPSCVCLFAIRALRMQAQRHLYIYTRAFHGNSFTQAAEPSHHATPRNSARVLPCLTVRFLPACMPSPRLSPQSQIATCQTRHMRGGRRRYQQRVSIQQRVDVSPSTTETVRPCPPAKLRIAIPGFAFMPPVVLCPPSSLHCKPLQATASHVANPASCHVSEMAEGKERKFHW